MNFRNLIFAITALGFVSSPAIADHHMAKAIKVDKALSILTNPKGLSLYVFDMDKPGASNCNGGCANNWPPFMATADAKGEGKFTVITRTDGSRQWAHNGKPLYRWIGDQQAGDVSGDGVGGVWHLAKP